MLIAIRHATYGETLEMDIACPKCDHNNHVGINISQTTSTIGKLEPEYFVDMNEDIRIFVIFIRFGIIIFMCFIMFTK